MSSLPAWFSCAPTDSMCPCVAFTAAEPQVIIFALIHCKCCSWLIYHMPQQNTNPSTPCHCGHGYCFHGAPFPLIWHFLPCVFSLGLIYGSRWQCKLHSSSSSANYLHKSSKLLKIMMTDWTPLECNSEIIQSEFHCPVLYSNS